MATEKPRYSITVDDDLFQQIEEFRFTNRFQTRNQATLELIRLGLEALNNERKNDSEKFKKKDQRW